MPFTDNSSIKLDGLRNYCRDRRLEDQWWVAVDEKVLDVPMKLAQVAKLAQELPGGEISVINLSETHTSEPEWFALEKPKPEPISQQEPKTRGRGTKPSDVLLSMKRLESRVEFLQNTVDAMLNMLQELDSFEELRKTLQERQEFITRSEEELLNQTLAFDEKVAELEQKREDAGL